MIALFSGHYNKDSGAVFPDAIEAHINAFVTINIANHLSIMGIPNTTYGGSFPKKIGEANSDNVSWGLSVHCNSYTDNNAQGMRTYIYSNNSKSRELSDEIHKTWSNLIHGSHREITKIRPSLVILYDTNFPIVLVELGYLSNAMDKSMLLDNKELKRIAFALTSSLVFVS